MRLLSRKTDSNTALSPAPGMYAGESGDQVIFDRTTRLSVERNHWKLATLGLVVVALAAILTRQPPEPQVRAFGVSADAGGKPVVRELEAYQPSNVAIQAAFKDLVVRWFTIEPILTEKIEDSRMSKSLRSVKEQMIGAARGQFDDWVVDDEPVKAVSASPGLTREPKVTNVSVLPDSTVVVDFVTTTVEEGRKPKPTRYALTVRYQIKPPTGEAILGPNPFGVHPVFFTLQKSGV